MVERKEEKIKQKKEKRVVLTQFEECYFHKFKFSTMITFLTQQ